MSSIFLLFLIGFYGVSKAFDCTTYTTVTTCEATGSCLWVDSTGVCKCKSEVKMDIFFSIDSSGSIEKEPFQEAKAWLVSLIELGISNSTRMAFETYASYTNYSTWSKLRFWEEEDAVQFLNTMWYSGGFTRTDWVTQDMIDEFNRTEYADAKNGFDNSRQRINLLVTDGNPCKPPGGKACPYDICYMRDAVFAADVRIIIIGVGPDLNPDYLDCLLQDEDDYFSVANYSIYAFNAIFSELSDILCPVTYSALVTEVKVVPTGFYEDATDERDLHARFVEVYNEGVAMNLSHIRFDSFLVSDETQFEGIIVPQTSYVVFYDAEDPYAPNFPNVTCDQCDETSCTKGAVCDGSYDAPCHCQNAMYIPCGDCSVASDLSFYGCCFDRDYNNTQWEIQMYDVQSSTEELLDEVVYDPPTWLKVQGGYAYELINKAYDNDLGSNWDQSCNNLGTPGADPGADCESTCILNTTCSANGASNATCDSSGCICPDGYYASGTTCLPVLDAANCTVVWTRNGTRSTSESIAIFHWDYAPTSVTYAYRVTSYPDSNYREELYSFTYGNTLHVVDFYEIDVNGDKAYHTFYKVEHNSSLGVAAGYVTSFITVDGVRSYGETIPCILTTQGPTASPTEYPTAEPTPYPTGDPTPPPTSGQVYFYFVPDDCVEEPRCECEATAQYNYYSYVSWDCCMDYEDFVPDDNDDEAYCTHKSDEFFTGEVKYYRVDRSPEYYEYDTSVCWNLTNGTIVYDSDDDDDDDDDRRRLISSQRKQLQNGKTLKMNYYFGDNSDGSRKILTSDDSDLDGFNSIGLRVTPTYGCINFTAGDDFSEQLSFEFEELCDYDSSEECLEDVSYVEYHLNLTSCQNTNPEIPLCDMVHPNYILLSVSQEDTIVSSGQTSNDLPGWIWWLIAALVAFLVILALLLYKFWWSARQGGQALNKADADIDAANEEFEMGFGHDVDPNNVGFNPLATGNMGANPAGNPNAGLGDAGGGNQMDVARTQDDKLVFRQEFGARQG